MTLKVVRLPEAQSRPGLRMLSPEAGLLTLIAAELQRGQDSEAFLASVHPLLARAADTDWMMVLEKEEDTLILRMTSGLVPTPILEYARRPVPRGVGLSWQALSENRAIFVGHYATQSAGVPAITSHFKGASAYLPLPDRSGKARGILLLASTAARKKWSPRTQVALEAAASMIGTALAWQSEMRVREQRERELRESGERLHALFSQAAVGMALVSLEGRFVSLNQRLCDMLGYTQEDMQQTTFAAITHVEDREVDLERLQQMRAGNLSHFTREKRYVHRSGATVWIQLTASLVRGQPGEPMYVLSVMEDITARKRSAEEVLSLNASLERRVEDRTRQLERNNRELEQLMKDAQRHAEDQRYLADLTLELESQDDPSELIKRISDRLLVLIDAPLIITLIGTPASGADVWSVSGQAPEALASLLDQRISSQASPEFWDAVARMEPRYVDDVQQAGLAGAMVEPARSARLASAAHVPFPVLADQVGVLVALRFGAPSPWTSEQRTLLEATVNAFNLSFQRAARIRELNASRRYAEAMVAISRLTEQDRPREEIDDAVAGVLVSAADIDFAILARLERDGCFAISTFPAENLEPGLQEAILNDRSLLEGSIWSGLQPGEPLLLDDYAAYIQARPQLVRLGTRSVAVIPLSGEMAVSQQVLLAVRLKRARPWTARDRLLFEAAARSIRLAHERQRNVQELRSAALSDALTGLGNRRAFNADLEAALARARNQGHLVTLVSMDLDGLKAVNDREGHERGDLLLRGFATTLQCRLRSSDRLYRLGGDEFAAILERTDERSHAIIRERIRQAILDVRAAGFPRADVSSGFASFPHEAETAARLVALSDYRMYQEKQRHHRDAAA